MLWRIHRGRGDRVPPDRHPQRPLCPRTIHRIHRALPRPEETQAAALQTRLAGLPHPDELPRPSHRRPKEGVSSYRPNGRGRTVSRWPGCDTDVVVFSVNGSRSFLLPSSSYLPHLAVILQTRSSTPPNTKSSGNGRGRKSHLRDASFFPSFPPSHLHTAHSHMPSVHSTHSDVKRVHA